ncbi:MAG TPA: TonB family protein [Lacunisphaera sp.]|nr:TonB family protein [Lacunisphaera sp.]
MNSTKFLLAATVAGGLLSSAVIASAAVVVDPSVMAETASYTAPAPAKIVSPTGIARRYQGQTIRVSLTIDEAGQPHNINLLSDQDPHLMRQLVPAVAKWQFTPAKRNGHAVRADVVLPIQLVDGSSL